MQTKSWKIRPLAIFVLVVLQCSGYCVAPLKGSKALCLGYNAATQFIPNPLVVPKAGFSVEFSEGTGASFAATDINIQNLKTINFDQCDVDPDNAIWHSSIDLVEVFITDFILDGMLVDNIDLYGNGPGYVSIEDLDVTVWGNGTQQADSLVLDNVSIDLDIYRWTIALENIMPGTDLGVLFNEFFTMLGPETIEAMQNGLNGSINPLFLKLCNKILKVAGIPRIPGDTNEPMNENVMADVVDLVQDFMPEFLQEFAKLHKDLKLMHL